MSDAMIELAPGNHPDDERILRLRQQWGELSGGPDYDSWIEGKLLQAEDELAHVTDLIDDVLYDPSWHPIDENRKPIKGNGVYLLDHPVQENHMPALREWFYRRYE